MPTHERLKQRALSERTVDLIEAAARVGYSPEYLRKLMVTADPPPLFKRRGKWFARVSNLDAWIARRDGVAS